MIFGESVYRDRVARLKSLMEEWGVDLIAILDDENYQYLSGEFRRQPRLYIPRDGEPLILVFRGEVEEAERSTWIRDVRSYNSLHEMMMHVIGFIKEYNVKTVGFDFEFALPAFLLERFKTANPTVRVIDVREMLMDLRMIKTSEEISLIKKAQEIARVGMETAREVLKEGVREREVAAEIDYAMRRRGAMKFGFPTFVNSGYRSNSLHGWVSEKEITRGELILIDVGPNYLGYNGDMTRMFFIGEPDDHKKGLIELYLRARRSAVKAAKPGAMMMSLDEAASKVVGEAGYGEYYVRGIAHGIGLAFEERPFPTIFPEDYVVELKSDMTISIGHSILSIPGMGGARVEDVYIITERGSEPLVEYEEGLIAVG
ncbi:MAG: Xaa-Pro peptidase family protein [Candidatus Bathyarchaeia archaeon]